MISYDQAKSIRMQGILKSRDRTVSPQYFKEKLLRGFVFDVSNLRVDMSSMNIFILNKDCFYL